MPPPKSSPGVISRDEVYTLPELQQRLNLGAWAMRQARRAGLKTLKIGRNKFVRGSDVMDFLERQSDA